MTQRRVGGVTLLVALAVVLAGCNGATTTTPGLEPAPASVSAEGVTDDVLAAVAETDSYVAQQRTNTTLTGNNQETQVSVTGTFRVDRAAEEYRAEQTSRSLGRSTEFDIYFVDGTLYQRSDQFAQRFSTEWIKRNVSGNTSELFRAADALGQLEVLLPNASLSLAGQTEVDGTEVYVVRGPVEEGAVERFAAGLAGAAGLSGATPGVNVTAANVTVYAAADTGRPVRVMTSVTVEGSGATASLGTVRVRSDSRISYEPVSVQLPAAADTAVNASEVAGG